MSQFEKRKKSVQLLRTISNSPNNYLIIHYSCESFIDKEDGQTPRITTIAVRYFESSQTKAFSIQEVAEQKKIPLAKIEDNYDMLELSMLQQYFEFVRRHENCFWIHWNMRDDNYGFYAIENRYRVLGGEPISIQNEKKIDLARVLIDCYGRKYIGHPRMEKLVEKNNFTKMDFLSGADEAEAFKEKQYIKLRKSTLRKVDLFYCIVIAAVDGTLVTDAKWKDKYGISIQGIYEVLREHWWFQVILFVLGLIIGILF